MLAEKILNHVYWTNQNIFPQGTRISIDHHYHVDWENQLMAPGQTIIQWESAYNYQGDKKVPQLPILKVNNHYRIVSHLSTVPEKSYIVRLIFRDLQGTELRHYDFNDKSFEFTVPSEPVSYSLALINGGCYQLHFERFDISSMAMDEQANQDVWLHEAINAEKSGNNIILLADSKQTRKTYPELATMTQLPVQLISVSWQSTTNLTRWLKEWIELKKLQKAHLIVASASLNMTALELTWAFPQLQLLLTTKIAGRSAQSWDEQPVSWGKPGYVNPDWLRVTQKMNRLWDRGEN